MVVTTSPTQESIWVTTVPRSVRREDIVEAEVRLYLLYQDNRHNPGSGIEPEDRNNYFRVLPLHHPDITAGSLRPAEEEIERAILKNL